MTVKYFKRLKSPDWARVLALRLQLEHHPQLWNRRRERLIAPPFVDTDDIWIRANDDGPFRHGERPWSAFNDPHWPIWYSEEIALLPAVKPIVREVMALVGAEHLGSVLITRIPAGKEVKPHSDFGWHCQFHNCKVYVPVISNNQCWNITGTERVNMCAGEAWQFENQVTHSVRNHGDTERITLIISMRVEP